MKPLFLLFSSCFFAGCCCAQATNTISSGLNQNEVNVVRDGDFPAEQGGVIRMVPDGKKQKTMTMVPDTVNGEPLNSSTSTVVTVPQDSTIRFKTENKNKAGNKNKTKPAGKSGAGKKKPK